MQKKKIKEKNKRKWKIDHIQREERRVSAWNTGLLVWRRFSGLAVLDGLGASRWLQWRLEGLAQFWGECCLALLGPAMFSPHASSVGSKTSPIPVSPPPQLDSTPGWQGSGNDPVTCLVLQARGLGILPNTPHSPGSHPSVNYSFCTFSNPSVSLQLHSCLLSPSHHHSHLTVKHPLGPFNLFPILNQIIIPRNANLSVAFHCS